MDEKFVYEQLRDFTWNIRIPKEALHKHTHNINLDFLAMYLRNVVFPQNYTKPGREMPLKLEIEAYMPVPKGKALWFKPAARKQLIPCVTVEGWTIFNNCIFPTLKRNGVINNLMQIHSFHYESTYSDHPRINLKITMMYQNIGDIKAASKRANQEERNGRQQDSGHDQQSESLLVSGTTD